MSYIMMNFNLSPYLALHFNQANSCLLKFQVQISVFHGSASMYYMLIGLCAHLDNSANNEESAYNIGLYYYNFVKNTFSTQLSFGSYLK